MSFANNMTLLVDKIELRLGSWVLDLPDELGKSIWPEKVIIPDTIVTYSRYFPHQFRYTITPEMKKKNGWYLLDEELFGDCKILGVKNIDWGRFNGNVFGTQYGMYDFMAAGYDIGDTFDLINAANVNSLFNNGIYPDFEPPNKFKLESTYGAEVHISQFDVYILLEHSPNLTTISPTQMETFEKLAISDVAGFLYNGLKMYDGVETVLANVNLRLDELQEKARSRDDVIQEIKEGYVSAANKNQPLMFCI